MTCRECAEFLSDYLDGELAAETVRIFEHHLSLCPNCVTYIEQLRITVRASQEAFGDIDVSEADVPEQLIQAILAARRV
jgi:anti-sigma factor RsiW